MAINSSRAKMANVSRTTCSAMVTLHVKMNQMKTIVNALPTCLPVKEENVSRQHMCATEKTTALTEMTKTIAVSTQVVSYGGLGLGLGLHAPNTKSYLNQANHTAFRLLTKHYIHSCEV